MAHFGISIGRQKTYNSNSDDATYSNKIYCGKKVKQTKLIHIYLFGDSTIQIDNKSYKLKRKSLGVFVYLAVQNRTIGRRELTSLFWPNVETVNGLQSLSALLYRYPDPIKTCLDIQDQSIKFKPEHVWLDLNQFEENINYANQIWQNEQALKKIVRNLLEQSVDLYRGGLVEDFYLKDHEEFMGWLVKERELFKQKTVDTLARLLRYAYQRANTAESIRFTNELLRIAPFDEDAHMALIKLFVDDGKKELAIQHFQSYQEKLFKELNATPGRPITTYYQELYNPVLVPLERRVTAADFKLLHEKSFQERKSIGQDNRPIKFQNSLPAQVVKLFGRERLISQLEREITAADNRLITLTGMGGIGKTQLAVTVGNQLSSEFKDGVVYIPVRNLVANGGTDSQEHLSKQISNQLALKTLQCLDISINENAPSFYHLIETLGRKEILLIYDNFEHLVEGASFFTTLLHAAAEITILVTSRVRLHQPSELIIAVPPLQSTAEASVAPELELGSGVQLFIDRAQRLNSTLEFDEIGISAIQTICTLTGGLPLAIEQAASWIIHYSLDEIAEEMHRSYTFLENPAAPLNDPHRSIKKTLEQSWNLLTQDEQHMLQTLSLFQNEFNRTSALTVSDAPLSTLISLTDRNLIQQMEPGWYSFHPLVAKMVQQKREKDSQYDIKKACKRFVAYFLAILEDWGEQDTFRKTLNADLLIWIRRIEDDIFQAWNWGITDRAYDQLVKGFKGMGTFFYVMPRPRRTLSLLHGSLTQLSNHVPDHLKQVELAPAHYTDLLTKVMLEYATILTFERNYPDAEKICSQALIHLEGANFYYTHAMVAHLLAIIYSRVDDQQLNYAKMRTLAAESVKFISGPAELADAQYQFVQYYKNDQEYEKAAQQALLSISYLDNSYAPVTSIAYNYVAQIRISQKRYNEAIELIDNYVDIEANTTFRLRHVGRMIKGKVFLLLKRPSETLALLDKIEDQVRLINHFFQVLTFYQIRILAKLELIYEKDNVAKEFIDSTIDAKRFIHWVEMLETPDKAYHAWITGFGYAALAAGQSIKGQMGSAQQAYLQFQIKLSLAQSLSIKYLEHLSYTLVLISHYYLSLGEHDLALRWMSYLNWEKDKLEAVIMQALDRLVHLYESRTGQLFEPLPFSSLPQNTKEVLQHLIDENVHEPSLTDFLDGSPDGSLDCGTEDSKIKA